MQTRAASRMGVHGLDLSALRAVFEPLHSWLELAKPGVTRLVLVTTLLGGVVAPGRLSFSHWLCVLLGTVLVVAAANALNMVSEADLDALMQRTRQRPLPSGRLDPSAAVRAALGAAVSGTALLLCIGVVPAVLALMALVSYVWLYTPLKRITPHALFVGAVPGAIPPLIGYA
ncbi:MAG TPA: UbiA family prenyltransferase, partial [Polyangiaceae bacterium]|nr:UbiA family prenyltransferase [Polyangiaceae bacterium]